MAATIEKIVYTNDPTGLADIDPTEYETRLETALSERYPDAKIVVKRGVTLAAASVTMSDFTDPQNYEISVNEIAGNVFAEMCRNPVA